MAGGGEHLPRGGGARRRASLEGACVWEAERAEADLAMLELVYEGGEDAQVLATAGQRWTCVGHGGPQCDGYLGLMG